MNKIIFLLCLILGVVSCTSVKPLRFDGVYKEYTKNGYSYRLFSEEPHKLYTYRCDVCSDEEAILELYEQAEGKGELGIGYRNGEKAVSYYGGGKSFSWFGDVKKNNKGEMENSIFLKVQDKNIVEKVELRERKKYQLYRQDGHKVTSESFEEISFYSNNYIRIKKNFLYGVYDIKNQITVLEPKYEWLSQGLYNDRIGFKIDGLVGFLNEQFEEIIPAKYLGVKKISQKYFVDGVQAVKSKGTGWFFINKDDRRLSESEFHEVGTYLSRKFVPVKKGTDKIFSYINLDTGKYYDFRSYDVKVEGKSNFLSHKLGKKHYLLSDKEGNLVFNQYFERVAVYETGNNTVFVKVGLKGKEGLFDISGNNIIPMGDYSIYGEYDIKDRLVGFEVAKKDKGQSYKGVLNLKGEVIIPLKFKSIYTPYVSGLYIANNGEKDFLFEHGDPNPIFLADKITSFRITENYLSIKIGDKYGVIDSKGNLLTDIVYPYISGIYDGLFAVSEQFGEKAIYNFDGELIKDSDHAFSFQRDYYYDREEGAIYDYFHKELMSTDLGGFRAYSYCGGKDLILREGKEEVFINVEEKVIIRDGIKSIKCMYGIFADDYIVAEK